MNSSHSHLLALLAASLAVSLAGCRTSPPTAPSMAPPETRRASSNPSVPPPAPALREIAGWGTVVDPDGDCKFAGEGPRLTITVPDSPHALAIERHQMNAPRILREVEADFVAKIKVTGQFPRGAKALIADRRPFHGAGWLLAKDDRNYLRLEKAELVLNGRNMSYVSFELRHDGVPVRLGSATEYPLDAESKNTFLRLERAGGQIIASVSADGITWAQLRPVTVDWPERLQLGVTAGHNTGSGFSASFELLAVTSRNAPSGSTH